MTMPDVRLPITEIAERSQRPRVARGYAGLLGMGLLLAGCAGTPLPIDNTEWELVGWREKPLAPGASAKPIELRIEQRQVLGYSGCNHYSGPYQITHGHFSSGPLRTTRGSCTSADLHAFEQAFLKALEDGGHLVVTDAERLRIEPRRGDALEFRRRP